MEVTFTSYPEGYVKIRSGSRSYKDPIGGLVGVSFTKVGGRWNSSVPIYGS